MIYVPKFYTELRCPECGAVVARAVTGAQASSAKIRLLREAVHGSRCSDPECGVVLLRERLVYSHNEGTVTGGPSGAQHDP